VFSDHLATLEFEAAQAPEFERTDKQVENFSYFLQLFLISRQCGTRIELRKASTGAPILPSASTRRKGPGCSVIT
jgi:hypothetical protein